MSPAALRGFFLENWGLKLLSLAFATLLWMFVVGEKRSEVSLSLPLELNRVPENMVIVSRVPESIRVRINGPRTLIASVNPQQLAVRLDLEGIQPGISAFEILPSRLNLPRGIEVTYISPSVITLEADLRVAKKVPVKPRIRGTPAEGFEVADVQVEPPEVEVEGAERVIRQLREIPTEVVDVTGLDGSVSRPVELAFPDPSVRQVEKRPIRLSVNIREIRAEREFVQVPVHVPTPEWRTIPPFVDVKVEGPLRTISQMASRDVFAGAEPFQGRPPEQLVRVLVEIPPELRLISVEPDRVKLERVHVSGLPARGAGAEASRRIEP